MILKGKSLLAGHSSSLLTTLNSVDVCICRGDDQLVVTVKSRVPLFSFLLLHFLMTKEAKGKPPTLKCLTRFQKVHV